MKGKRVFLITDKKKQTQRGYDKRLYTGKKKQIVWIQKTSQTRERLLDYKSRKGIRRGMTLSSAALLVKEYHADGLSQKSQITDKKHNACQGKHCISISYTVTQRKVNFLDSFLFFIGFVSQ